MPFCPSCRTEYRQGTERCGDCDVDLVDTLPPEEEPVSGERVDVYICYEEQQMIRAVAVLAESNIEGMVRDRASSAFPMNVGTESMKILAVLSSDFQAARQALAQAIEDEVLPTDGEILDEPEEE